MKKNTQVHKKKVMLWFYWNRLQSFSQMVYWLQGSGNLNDKTGKSGGEMMGRQMDDM